MKKNINEKLLNILKVKFLISIQTLKRRHNLKKDFCLNHWEQMEMLFYLEHEF